MATYISPSQKYQTNGVVSPQLTAPVSLTATTNISVVSAQSGKKIAVLGVSGSSGVATGMAFKSANTTTLQLLSLAANQETKQICPLTGYGDIYFETLTGEALTIDSSAIATINVHYIIFTPPPS